MTEYELPHDLPGERRRLDLMSQLLDPLHRRLLEKLGVGAGWRCLEVGCGNGSISQWLAGRVAPGGHVVASDIEVRYLDGPHAPDLEVRQLNILDGPVEQGAYDVVTARALLHHLPSAKEAVQRMIAALKPGGVLLSIEPDFLPATVTEPEVMRSFWEGWLQWSRSVGIDYFIGRKMPAMLTQLGLQNVGAEGDTAIYTGGSNWAWFWLDTLQELRPKLIESGYVNQQCCPPSISCMPTRTTGPAQLPSLRHGGGNPRSTTDGQPVGILILRRLTLSVTLPAANYSLRRSRRSRLYEPAPWATTKRKKKQKATASSPLFMMGQKPCGACILK
jgi:SAM-dependent methyltransferase